MRFSGSDMRRLLSEKNIHLAFDVSLWLKGAFALLEIVGGVLAYFVTRQFAINAAAVVTQGELAEDPHDLIATYLLHTAQGFSVSTQHFTALYLFGHGVVKLWLIVGLLRERLWYYPVALVAFALFIVYQLYRYQSTHSVWLILLTLLDIVVIWLTWHEYRFLRSGTHSSGAS